MIESMEEEKYEPAAEIRLFYQIYREQGGTSNFSTFINDVVKTHLEKCHGFLIGKLIVMEKVEEIPLYSAEDIKKIKEEAKALGLIPPTSDIALKLEELKQSIRSYSDREEREQAFYEKKLDWEMRRWEKEQETSQKQMELIANILKGSNLPKSGRAYSSDQMVRVMCANCQQTFNVYPNLEEVQCPYCQVRLRKTYPQKTETEKAKDEEPKPSS